ncbi:helix-turn-helix domain-containing protein [Clostridium septicum]|uniref:Helix-turn-helix domain-containing protein n=1 Tax=Clostridium septicum TaxID=1504 RepID=A0A9N7JMB1_CLOSE|nr:helix-turn-helix domain-containing protein [Clostridium septicum]AYE35183.1 hypothetical protein CP523_12540 [Clostridium septicum]MDU1313142.1 helix-turn-helix domain-containing protein [Clostridium septicum]QAS60586.1 hypothetical protein EI377_07430 [Clostridium septicum]UEC20166.1 helix-turn-helix domain-containing protein [Clostridium septicum]USS01779.1 helix-turn-helix domain-containing protein [Clostridium septicum]
MNEKGYTVINNLIFEDDNLTLEEKYFLIVLKRFHYKDIGEIYPTYKVLMSLCSTKRRAKVSKLIKSLMSKDYIEVKKIKGCNCYYFKKDYLLEDFQVTSNPNNRTENNPNNETRNNNRSSKNSYCECSKNETLKIQNKKIYINIINHWNSSGILEANIDRKTIDAIDIILKKYDFEEIIQGIDNYGIVYRSQHYYNYVWTLEGFLTKENGLSRFIRNGDIWTSYLFNSEKKKGYINIEDYID